MQRTWQAAAAKTSILKWIKRGIKTLRASITLYMYEICASHHLGYEGYSLGAV